MVVRYRAATKLQQIRDTARNNFGTLHLILTVEKFKYYKRYALLIIGLIVYER